MVEELKGQGLKVVIITNGHPQIQRGKLERLQASSMFDAILVGGEEIAAGGREKPAASIFLKACQLAGCLPSEVRTIPLNPFSFICQLATIQKLC